MIVATIVEALLVGAIQREMNTRKVYGKPTHLVLFDDAKVLRAARDVGLAYEASAYDARAPKLPVWSWERWA